MKKTLLILVATTALATTACTPSGDGFLTMPSTGELVTPSANYEIDTWGSNSEVYEITSKVNPNYTCMMVMLDSGVAMGLACFPTNGS